MDSVNASNISVYLIYSQLKKYPPEVFCKKMCWKFREIYRKTLVPESLFLTKLQASACNFIKVETLAQVFSCEFCEIFKNTFFYKTPPVAASVAEENII